MFGTISQSTDHRLGQNDNPEIIKRHRSGSMREGGAWDDSAETTQPPSLLMTISDCQAVLLKWELLHMKAKVRTFQVTSGANRGTDSQLSFGSLSIKVAGFVTGM